VRRLNTEAAKAIKYGGLKPETALKFVTINPAIQLGIDKHVGSLEQGKHADVAIWSGNPLSVYSRCVATWVDGRELFTLEKDEASRDWIRKERARLIAKALADPKPPGKPKKTKAPDEDPKFYDCGECGAR
jgi:adenine deaminase